MLVDIIELRHNVENVDNFVDKMKGGVNMEDLVKVQCILESGYNDTDLGEYIEYNQIYFVSEERANLLKDKKAVIILKDDIEEIEKPKKRNRRRI